MEDSNAAGYNKYNEPYKQHTMALFDATNRSEDDEQSESRCRCSYCDSADNTDGGGCWEKDQSEKAKEKLFKKCFRICLLSCVIIGYTFVGAVLFLVNEENVSATTEQITSALLSDKLVPPPSTNESAHEWFSKLGEESRNWAVQNIWNITVNLNILYRQNWSILAADELIAFQDRLLEKLWQEKTYLETSAYTNNAQRTMDVPPTHWKLGKAFLYSMSILSTIGFGNTLARSSNSKLTTMLYAGIGLPVMYMYLSSVGSLLSNCARYVFSRTLCCCLCSKCGYCCYDEKLMEEKERRMKRKRQQREYRQRQMAAAMAARNSQPFYVVAESPSPSPSVDSLMEETTTTKTIVRRRHDKDKRPQGGGFVDSRMRNEYSRFLAPLVVCLLLTFSYVLLGSFALLKLDGTNWTLIDSVYFSFMLITTVGMGDSMPAGSALLPNAQYDNLNGSLLVWFFSFYIFVGLAFSAMCYCTVHDGVKRKMNKLYLFSDRLRRRCRTRSRRRRETDADLIKCEIASHGTGSLS